MHFFRTFLHIWIAETTLNLTSPITYIVWEIFTPYTAIEHILFEFLNKNNPLLHSQVIRKPYWKGNSDVIGQPWETPKFLAPFAKFKNKRASRFCASVFGKFACNIPSRIPACFDRGLIYIWWALKLCLLHIVTNSLVSFSLIVSIIAKYDWQFNSTTLRKI